jgi:hypothetical protein
MTITVEPRAFKIRQRLDHHYLGVLEVHVATPEPMWWWDHLPAFGPMGPLGWGWPVLNAGSDTPILITSCPEIIDQQTSLMSNAELDEYLNLIEFCIDLQVAYWTTEERPVERFSMTMDALSGDNPEAFHWLAAFWAQCTNHDDGGGSAE